MAKFKIGYTMETWHSRVIEADTREEAYEQFYDRALYLVRKGATTNGEYLQDSVEIEEVLS